MRNQILRGLRKFPNIEEAGPMCMGLESWVQVYVQDRPGQDIWCSTFEIVTLYCFLSIYVDSDIDGDGNGNG